MNTARTHLAAALALGLAAAGPARAQTASAGTVIPAINFDVYVNGGECDPANALPIDLAWQVLVPGGALSSGIYRVYVSNKAHATKSGSTLVLCSTADDSSTSTKAGQIGGNIVATPSDLTVLGEFAASDLPATAGLTCDAAADRNLYVCVNFFPYVAVNQPAADPTGFAVGTFILSTGKPGTPTGLTLGVGDGRLYAEWKTPSSGVANTARYDVVTTPVNPADPTPGVKQVVTTYATIDGLLNSHDYSVKVYALSPALTRGDPTAEVIGTPSKVADFWDVYTGRAGQETGGCGGPGGPLALLAAAGALALLRRRS